MVKKIDYNKHIELAKKLRFSRGLLMSSYCECANGIGKSKPASNSLRRSLHMVEKAIKQLQEHMSDTIPIDYTEPQEKDSIGIYYGKNEEVLKYLETDPSKNHILSLN